MTAAKIEGRGLEKEFDGHRALDGLNISIGEGSIHGLLGPNGAGKTTFIRMVTQILRPDRGEIEIDGRAQRADDIKRIGYLPEERGLYPRMRSGEQVVYYARLHGMSRVDATAKAKEWFERLGIGEWWGHEVRDLSKGMQQKVQFITAVIHGPEILIFDEPFSGFDPLNAQAMRGEMMELRKGGATIVLASHDMMSVQEMCDTFTLIDKSRDVLSGEIMATRRAFSDGLTRVEIIGSEAALRETGLVEIVRTTDTGAGRTQAVVRASRAGTTRQELIRGLLERLEVTAFSEELPTMTDIFIKLTGEK